MQIQLESFILIFRLYTYIKNKNMYFLAQKKSILAHHKDKKSKKIRKSRLKIR